MSRCHGEDLRAVPCKQQGGRAGVGRGSCAMRCFRGARERPVSAPRRLYWGMHAGYTQALRVRRRGPPGGKRVRFSGTVAKRSAWRGLWRVPYAVAMREWPARRGRLAEPTLMRYATLSSVDGTRGQKADFGVFGERFFPLQCSGSLYYCRCALM